MSINIRTDFMQHAELFGNPVLFTNWLIQRDTIPKDWYCYDLRGTRQSPNVKIALVDKTARYAELMAREKYPDLPSELFQTPQAAQIGRTMLEEGNGAITEYGLIRRTDGRPLPVFTGKPQREEFAGPQMTGM